MPVYQIRMQEVGIQVLEYAKVSLIVRMYGESKMRSPHALDFRWVQRLMAMGFRVVQKTHSLVLHSYDIVLLHIPACVSWLVVYFSRKPGWGVGHFLGVPPEQGEGASLHQFGHVCCQGYTVVVACGTHQSCTQDDVASLSQIRPQMQLRPVGRVGTS